MLNVKRFTVNPLQENCYLVYDDNKVGALIDCGALYKGELDSINTFIDKESIQLTAVLQTHAHFDHIFGLPHIYEKYGLKPQMHAMELSLYEDFHESLAMFGMPTYEAKMPPVESFFNDGDLLSIGDETLEVIHTPGHTPGGVCFYNKTTHILFSGDTLFNGSIGRSDFPGGSHKTLINSIRERLMSLPPETIVYSGHGGGTTIGSEKACNPFL